MKDFFKEMYEFNLNFSLVYLSLKEEVQSKILQGLHMCRVLKVSLVNTPFYSCLLSDLAFGWQRG